MDKSLRGKKSITRAQKVRIFLLSLILVISAGLPVSGEEETASFHITAKDLNLPNFEPIFKEYSPQIKYAGDISLEANFKIKKGTFAFANGDFSSNKLSLVGLNSSFPLNLSNVEGNFEIELTDGKPTVKGKIRSSEGQWGQVYFQSLQADYLLLEKRLDISNCEIKLANGTVYLNGNIDFTKNPPVFFVKLTGEKINVGSILEKWGNTRPISGTLFADGTLSGEFGKPTTYSGMAKIKIEEGNLGEIGLIGRILTFSPLAAVSGDLSLTTLEGDFDISEGYASTDNVIIKGPGMKITAIGNVGWNKKLDFILSVYASSEIMKGFSITKMLGVIMDDFGNILRKIKLNGTIANPEFTIIPLGIGRTIKEGFEKSFKNGPSDTNKP